MHRSSDPVADLLDALRLSTLRRLVAAAATVLLFGAFGPLERTAKGQDDPSSTEEASEGSDAAEPPPETDDHSNSETSSTSDEGDASDGEGRPDDAESPASPSADQLLKEAGSIADRVARIRGLAPLDDIEKGVKTREELRAILVEKLAEEQTDRQMRQEAAVFRKLGLIPEDLDYREVILDVLTEQIAGFYDQKEGKLNIMVGIPLDLQRPAMAHEIFHAIQDQHFDLTRMLEPFESREHGDFHLARSALIEGDATVLMIDFALYQEGTLPRNDFRSLVDIPMLANMLKQLDYGQLGALEQLSEKGTDGANGGGSDESDSTTSPTELFDSSLSEAPPIIRRVLIFPYLAGMRFVIAMRSGRTWSEFDDIYRRPPVSAEQILHPERYAERDEPVVLNYDPSAVLDSYDRIYDTVLGEFQMQLFLEQHTGEGETQSGERSVDVEKATTGWDGDRLLAFENDEGRVLLTHLSVWDSRRDAKEYYNALIEVSGRRFPETSKRTADGEYGASTCLYSDTGDRSERIYLERWGDAVLHIEGAPTELDEEGDETDPTTYLLRDQIWETVDRRPFRRVYRERMNELEDREGRQAGE